MRSPAFSKAEVRAGATEGMAVGLMQITEATIKTLANEHGELKDHLINLGGRTVYDPNITICAGIRWLIHKKQLAERNSKTKLSWPQAIAKYKAYPVNHPQLKKFRKLYNRLSKTKPPTKK